MDKLELTLAPLFQGLSDGICVSDAEGRILYLNHAAERLFGSVLASTAGRSICDLLCGRLTVAGDPECASHCPLRDLRDPRDGQKSVTFMGSYEQKPAYRWLEVDIKRLQNGKGVRVRCIRMPASALDADQREKHFTIIEDAAAELELERRKEDWHSMLAHDLRSPLTNVFGILKTMEEDAVKAKASVPPNLEMLAIGVRNCRRIMELIDLYLDTAKFDAGAMSVVIASFNLAPVVRRCVEEQLFFAKERRIEVAVDLPLDFEVEADPQLLPRAIQNLLHNALKFSMEGGHVDISAKLVGPDAAEISIRDDGPGIAPEEIPRLFDRFHQAKAGRQGNGVGIGLGLAFCRQALEAMHGRVSVESPPGSGSIFTLHLKRSVPK